MPNLQISLSRVPAPLVEGFEQLRETLGVPPVDFSTAVISEVEEAIKNPPSVPKDMTDIEFVTIDPEGSMDLDQAMCIKRDGDGYVVYYAIADVAAWVRPGGALDAATHQRVQTFYAPNLRSPLHPPRMSEGAASLLADGVARPAHVWTLKVDKDGVNTEWHVERAMVKNTQKLTYVGVQADIDSGKANETLMLLKEVGQLREQQEIARGGVSLPIPEQDVFADGNTWNVEFRSPLPVEGWNAQISLMTGMAAAQIMLGAKIGILRTLPPVEAESLSRLRRSAKALHIEWPSDMRYPEFLRSLDATLPTHMAMLQQCTRLFRGAGYASFNGKVPDENLMHNALACYYAHTTAPLRRLVDRYSLEICTSVCAGIPVPQWVLDQLETLPTEMQDSNKREKQYERGVVNLVEALIMSSRVGQEFTGTVVERPLGAKPGCVLLMDPAVEANVFGWAPLGDDIQVRCTKADVKAGVVEFESLEKRGARTSDRQNHDERHVERHRERQGSRDH